jgi:signal transduction histidine kinase
MSILSNPVLMRAAFGFFLTVAIVFMGMWLIRKARPTHDESGGEFSKGASPESPLFAVETYNGVIRKLKDQEQELQKLRQEASARASASENISTAVLTNLTSGVVFFGVSSLVQQANKAAREILGYSSPVGLHARDLFKGVVTLRRETGESYSSPDPLLEALELCMTQGIPYRRMELEFVTPSSEARVLGVTFSPVKSQSGAPLGVACLVSDLTEITSLSRQIRVRDNLASLGEMSAGIAHEFKNSLATISGYAQMLSTSPDETAKDFGQRITTETASLNRIVTDFLSFARPQELRATSIDFAALIEDCKRDTRIHIQCDSLPPRFALFGDQVALRQVFSNLFRNAAESAGSGLPVLVRVAVKAYEDTAEISVSDNGPGIPRENLDKIFIPFFTTKPNGTGLGLALVHRIVTEHGGTVSVDTAQTGTTFTLSLPLGKPSSKTAETR